MKKANKKSKNKFVVPLIIVLSTILVISGALLIYLYTQNYIVLEYIDNKSLTIDENDVTKVSPIVMNNIVIGGVSDKGKFINKADLFDTNNLTKGTEIDMYNISGKMGTFEIYSVRLDSNKKVTYAIPLKDVMDEEYVAVLRSDKNIMTRALTKIKPTKTDEKYVKKALGKYIFLNNTVKVNEVYEGYLDNEQKTRIITATSKGKNNFGVYSVAVYVRGDNASIIKYAYVKNTESSVNWPVYSIKFACDLNYDDKYEILLQEARETTMKYSVLEFKDNRYKEVIGFEFEIK